MSALQDSIEGYISSFAGVVAWQALPSVRDLARKFKCSQKAVREAVEVSTSTALVAGITLNGQARAFPRLGDYRVQWTASACPPDATAASGTRAVRKPTVIRQVRAAGKNHQVVTVEGGAGGYRRKPCSDCPWRVDATGVFPAAAFKVSAPTAYDMATHTFVCHQSGHIKPAVCAGFLLRGAEHNLAVRLGLRNGRFRRDVTDGGHQLHTSYRSMAIENGVDPNDPVLSLCREPSD